MNEPVFVFDSRERFHPLAVESVEAISDVRLDALPPEGGRMDFPPDPESYEPDLQRRFGNVGYTREVRGGGLLWRQYWLWYIHNPKRVLVTGDHEGDWEMVQIGYAGEAPVCATASRHRNGEARFWWDVELRGGRPVIYPARGSHANFFKPVDGIDWIEDDGDGKGAVLDAIEWREFGDWAAWPGRWGNSSGRGLSPESPGRQDERWNHPHRFHSRARSDVS